MRRAVGRQWAVLIGLLTAATGLAAEGAWKPSASVSLREAYDSNVYLQDHTDLARQESMVTQVGANLGLTYTAKADWDTTLGLGYNPQYTHYHAEDTETHYTHGVTARLLAKRRAWTVELNNALTHIDGDDEGLIFTGPGGAPAIGGIATRDRRDATIFRNSYRLTWAEGAWLVRPVFTGYVHDFHTDHRTTPGYNNFVDRNDFSGGADVGYKVAANLYALAGYRYGEQHQAELLTSPIDYSNRYHRVLVGAEGKATDWLKVAVLVGPDFRTYTGDTAAGFDREHTSLFVDGSVTVTPSKADEITLTVRQFEQPGFGGRSAYEDITYQLAYKRKLTDRLTGTATLQAYSGQWLAPVLRDDWIYTVNLSAAYKFTPHLTGEAGWSLDVGESDVPRTSGREFTRNIVWVGVKWDF